MVFGEEEEGVRYTDQSVAGGEEEEEEDVGTDQSVASGSGRGSGPLDECRVESGPTSIGRDESCRVFERAGWGTASGDWGDFAPEGVEISESERLVVRTNGGGPSPSGSFDETPPENDGVRCSPLVVALCSLAAVLSIAFVWLVVRDGGRGNGGTNDTDTPKLEPGATTGPHPPTSTFVPVVVDSSSDLVLAPTPTTPTTPGGSSSSPTFPPLTSGNAGGNVGSTNSTPTPVMNTTTTPSRTSVQVQAQQLTMTPNDDEDSLCAAGLLCDLGFGYDVIGARFSGAHDHPAEVLPRLSGKVLTEIERYNYNSPRQSYNYNGHHGLQVYKGSTVLIANERSSIPTLFHALKAAMRVSLDESPQGAASPPGETVRVPMQEVKLLVVRRVVLDGDGGSGAAPAPPAAQTSENGSTGGSAGAGGSLLGGPRMYRMGGGNLGDELILPAFQVEFVDEDFFDRTELITPYTDPVGLFKRAQPKIPSKTGF